MTNMPKSFSKFKGSRNWVIWLSQNVFSCTEMFYRKFSSKAFNIDLRKNVFFNSVLVGKTVFLKQRYFWCCSYETCVFEEKTYDRANQATFINKFITKKIKKRSRLRNKYLNNLSKIDRKAYNQYRIWCVTLIIKTKQKSFENISTTDVTDNITFWRKVKRFLHR